MSAPPIGNPCPPSTPRRRRHRALLASLIAATSIVGVIAVPADPLVADVRTNRGWRTAASLSAGSVVRGRTISFRVAVSAATARRGRVVLAASGPGGRVYRRSFQPRRFAAGRTYVYTARWTVPGNEPLGGHAFRAKIVRRGEVRHRNTETFQVRRRATAPRPPTNAQFFEDFQTPAGLDRFQTQVFHGDHGRFTVRTWKGDHNHGCQGPTTLRTIHASRRSEMIWWCAPAGPETGHVMTSLFTTGYAHVDLSPNQSFNNVRRVCWDQNLTRLGRKWTQVTILPESVYRANNRELVYVHPGLESDVAVEGHRLSNGAYMVSFGNGATETFTEASNSAVIGVGPEIYATDFGGSNTEDKAERFTSCMTDNEDGTITFDLERAVTEPWQEPRVTRTLAGRFPNGPSRVVFQDVTYDAPKGDVGDRRGGSDPRTTWHWDNIAVF